MLDAHAWQICEDAGPPAVDGTALLFQSNSAQELLDNAPWIRPELIIALFWLIRRDQVVLDPNN